MTLTPNTDNTEILKLDILQTYKRRFSPEGRPTNHSPFDDHDVIRYDDSVIEFDVPDIHGNARRRIEGILEAIHQGKPSQVILLAGNPGFGKTHLINSFKPFEKTEKLGYVFVRSSNHWKLSDFEQCLLEWVVNALCEPSIEGRHLLRDKIDDIAFRALEMLLETPGEIDRYKSKTVRNFFSKMWSKLTGSDLSRFRQAVEARDGKIFARLDFSMFADYVCGQFLFQRNNDFHRYVMHVLLRYLYKEDRPKVRAWLKGESVHEYFLKKLGVYKELNRKDRQFEVLKILVSLFTPNVSKKLRRPDGQPGKDYVFFFAYDQAETRHAMFETHDEWRLFFAHLAELYNSLPNVLICFTMPLGLRDMHLASMEGQFKDRIRQDPDFILNDVSKGDLLDLYQGRIRRWLGDDFAELTHKLEAIKNPFLPLEQSEVLELGHGATIREAIHRFDKRFCQRLLEFPIDVPTDFHAYVKQLKPQEAKGHEHSYTEDHLHTIEDLIEQMGSALAERMDISYQGYEIWKTPQTAIPALRLQFALRSQPLLWFRVYVVRLGYAYTDRLDECLELLRNLPRARYHLWLVRANHIKCKVPAERAGKIFLQPLEPQVDAELQAAISVWRQKSQYSADAWDQGHRYLLERVLETYIDEMLRQTKHALEKLQEIPEEIVKAEEIQSEVGRISNES